MTTRIEISVDQLSRPQPGGIATYVRGLLAGLREVADDRDLVVTALAPRGGRRALDESDYVVRESRLSHATLTRAWRHVPLTVSRDADVVHATSLAGPFGGGLSGTRHSVAVHDLLWRDYPELSSPRGMSFHERRLQYVLSRDEIRLLTISPAVAERLVREGLPATRVATVRLGVAPAPATTLRLEELAQRVGVPVDDLRHGFTLCVGTLEPRKNLEHLAAAHARAREVEPALGPLVLAGPRGWGDVNTGAAITVGSVTTEVLAALRAHCRIGAFVPVDEGWGLPAVEFLAAGRPVVVTPRVPSVANNAAACHVAGTDVDSIAVGLQHAVAESDDDDARRARVLSVSHLTWRQCALDHLEAWR